MWVCCGAVGMMRQMCHAMTHCATFEPICGFVEMGMCYIVSHCHIVVGVSRCSVLAYT